MTTTSLTQKHPSLLQRVRDRFRRDYDQSKPTSPQALSLMLALRRLWSDHVIWTREYVVAAIADAPDAGTVAGRLLKNQEDLGKAVVPLSVVGPPVSSIRWLMVFLAFFFLRSRGEVY